MMTPRDPVVGHGPVLTALQGAKLSAKEKRELSKVDNEVRQTRNDLNDAQKEIAKLKAEVEYSRKDRQKMTLIDQEIQKAAMNLKDKKKEMADLKEENERLRQLVSDGSRDAARWFSWANTDLQDAKQEITSLREENMKMKDMIAAKYAAGGQ